jgi:putative membrane protein
MSIKPHSLVLAWLVIGLWLIVTLTSFFAPALLSANDARFINVTLMSVFTLLHGAQRYRLSGILVFFALAVVVANATENLSIVTGFPFGQYHHTAAMGPRIAHVPLIIGPIFAVAGYLSWVIAGVLLGDVFAAPRRTLALARPVIAAFVTTTWDFCVDAIGGTVNRDWIWADGGPWFGVPWLNFFGWMLTMWLIFQAFAVYLKFAAAPTRVPARSGYWLQPIVFWALIALQFPLLAAIVPAATLTDPAGGEWRSTDLFASMALVSVFTMGFTVVLATQLWWRARRADSAAT